MSEPKKRTLHERFGHDVVEEHAVVTGNGIVAIWRQADGGMYFAAENFPHPERGPSMPVLWSIGEYDFEVWGKAIMELLDD